MIKNLRRALFALLVTFGLGTGVASAQTYNTSFEQQVIALVNDIRADAGLSTLVEDTDLLAAARAHSLDMATNDCFSHDSCNGTDWADRIYSYYDGSGIGENIAAGFTTPEAVVTAWMNSAGHRANILDADWLGIGVGYVYVAGSDYGHYWTQDFGTLAPVPEAESWAMLLAGLGLMAGIARRRSRA